MVMKDVQKEIKCFFQTNESPEYPSGLIWETHKAVIRGVLIKHGARIKKEREVKLTKLLSKIQHLEARHKHAQTIEGERKLFNASRQVTDLLQYRAKMALQIGRKYSYELRAINAVNNWREH